MQANLWIILACTKKYMIIRDDDHPELKWHFPEFLLHDAENKSAESTQHLHRCFGLDPVKCNPLFVQDQVHVMYCCKWGGSPQRMRPSIAKIRFVEIEELFDLSEHLNKALVELLPHVSFYLRH